MKSINKKTLISVIMPVYNAESYLKIAINSILGQTHRNWELIIVDDKSTDSSLKIAENIAKKDSRIKTFQNKKHSGVASTTNHALEKIKGSFIARMDADDISHPKRFQVQLNYLLNNPKTVAIGSQCYLINQHGKKIGEKTFPQNTIDIKKMMFYFYPLQQPSLMVNSSLLPRDFIWYQPGLQAAEEHELLFKLLRYGQVSNLPNFLLSYRFHNKNISRQQAKKDFYKIIMTRIKGITYYHYHPTFKAILMNLAQIVIVSLVPAKLVFSFYEKARGLKIK